MDELLQCVMRRYATMTNQAIPYMNLHECAKFMYDDCLSGKDQRCMKRAQDAVIMSFCAPLKDLQTFGWTMHPQQQQQEDQQQDQQQQDELSVVSSSIQPPIQALTILRHPVDRVWSMYRFQTKYCYKCMNLTEVYILMDQQQTGSIDSICIDQLSNHETANLLSTHFKQDATDAEKVQEAITNMKEFFTMIGLTEQVDATVAMLHKVFPWMNGTIEGSNEKCSFPHANASPLNNRCGPGDSHWELPPHPDDVTRQAIEQHNQMDLQLYQAAVQHFERQKRALGLL